MALMWVCCLWVQMRENVAKMLKINDRPWTFFPRHDKTKFMPARLIKHFKLVAGLHKINHV